MTNQLTLDGKGRQHSTRQESNQLSKFNPREKLQMSHKQWELESLQVITWPKWWGEEVIKKKKKDLMLSSSGFQLLW